MEVKFRIEERSDIEKKVTKKISEIKETFSHSNTYETKLTNILHKNRDFEPIDIFHGPLTFILQCIQYPQGCTAFKGNWSLETFSAFHVFL